MNKKTLVINFFGGPGTGKSTAATWLFAQLKMLGVDCEYVSEFAKDKVWEGNKTVFNCQMYLSGKQAFKIARCIGKVDVLITDSPILVGVQYNHDNPLLNNALLYEFNKYNNLNFFIKRNNSYNANGRNETESEAKVIDETMKSFLEANKVPYTEFEASLDGYTHALLPNVLECIKKSYQ